ncbi:hypothetical protein D3C80_1737700 [compost metagenome]
MGFVGNGHSENHVLVVVDEEIVRAVIRLPRNCTLPLQGIECRLAFGQPFISVDGLAVVLAVKGLIDWNNVTIGLLT